MTVYELVVVRPASSSASSGMSKNKARAPAASLLARISKARPSAATVKATADAKAALASSNLAKRKAEKLARRWERVERREGVRARLAARAQQLAESTQHKAEVAAALVSKAQEAVRFRAADTASRLKLAQRKNLTRAQSLAEKKLALERHLEAAANRRAENLAARKGKAVAFLQRAATAKELKANADAHKAQTIRAELSQRLERAVSLAEKGLATRLSANIRHSFRVAAVVSRKRAREMQREAKARAELEAAQTNAANLHNSAVETLRSKAAAENMRVAETVRGAAQAEELRRLALDSRASQRAARAAVQRQAISAKLLLPGERISPDAKYVITPRGSWKAMMSPFGNSSTTTTASHMMMQSAPAGMIAAC